MSRLNSINKRDIKHLESIYTDIKEINGIRCRITARVMNSLFWVELATNLDETDWAIKPQVHSKYLFQNNKYLKEKLEPRKVISHESGHFKIEFDPLVKNLEGEDLRKYTFRYQFW